MKVQTFFARNPVFAVADFVSAIYGQHDSAPRAASLLLAYHVKVGHLVRVRRGIYATVPPGFDPLSYPVDPYLVASKVTEDSVLAYHTALEFLGKAYSVHHQTVLMTSRAVRPFSFRGHNFKAARHPAKLRSKGEEMAGVVHKDRSGMEVRVTGYERTLVDVLDEVELSGGLEEVWRSLEMVEYFNLDKVVTYALLLENATTVAKVGYFLECHREELSVDEKHLVRLEKHKPRSPHYLGRRSVGGNHLVSRWNLVVPRILKERGWEELS